MFKLQRFVKCPICPEGNCYLSERKKASLLEGGRGLQGKSGEEIVKLSVIRVSKVVSSRGHNVPYLMS